MQLTDWIGVEKLSQRILRTLEEPVKNVENELGTINNSKRVLFILSDNFIINNICKTNNTYI